MSNYLGETPVDIKESPYADYTPVDWAMVYVGSYGQIDGSHHKTWVLDQVARILRGTPVVVSKAEWGPSKDSPKGLVEYRFTTGDPSQEYLAWVQEMLGAKTCGECYTNLDEKNHCPECNSIAPVEDQGREYDYDVGIAP